MRHIALEQTPFTPLDEHAATAFTALVQAALREDRADEDITTACLVAPEVQAKASIGFRSPGIVAGLQVAQLAFQLVDPAIRFTHTVVDGTRVNHGSVVAEVSGCASAMLRAERVALNFLARLSGTATLTHAYVAAVDGLPVRIADTRKTTPGLRALERYAVRAGGGFNHRDTLADAVLIKDNHLSACGGVANAVAQARSCVSGGTVIEVECERLEQVQEAMRAGADAILLDNMSLDQLRAAVQVARGYAALEASGGVMLGNVREIAQTGVDVISVGALTHGARSLDVGLDFVADPAVVKAR